MGSHADVIDDDKLLTTKVSTIEFDDVVSGEIAADAAAEIEKRSDVEWADPGQTSAAPTSVPPVTVNDTYFPNQTKSLELKVYDAGGRLQHQGAVTLEGDQGKP